MIGFSAALARAGALVGVFLAGALPALAQHDAAANFPSRTVHIVVSAPPGGGVDIAARYIADKLQKRWGQPVIVENRPGAGGNIGTEAVAVAEPDGYTWLACQPAPITTNRVMYKKLPFDPDAFEPLAIMTSIPNSLAVRESLPVNSVKELIAYAKANPGKLNFGSQGVGTTPHLTGELFARMTATQLTHVPYRGTAAAVNDLVGGQIDMLFFQVDSVRAQYLAHKVKLLAVTTDKRVESVADIPTMSEAGVPGFHSSTWNALMAPPKTPAPILAKINQAINDVLKDPESIKHFRAINMEPVGGKPDEIRKFIREETERWGDVIRAAKIMAK